MSFRMRRGGGIAAASATTADPGFFPHAPMAAAVAEASGAGAEGAAPAPIAARVGFHSLAEGLRAEGGSGGVTDGEGRRFVELTVAHSSSPE